MNLYNKYRPIKFNDVAQPFVTTALKTQIINNTHVSSYIFSGPSGVGKTTIARIMAMALCCKYTKDGEPCGKCEDCISIIQDRHRDVIEHNCAVSGGVDDMRTVIVENMIIAPISGWRIFILDEAQLITMQGQNSLLKTLEEPPPHVKFFICTTEPNKILPAIQTRCQHFRLIPVSSKDIINILVNILNSENIDTYEIDALKLIAEHSNGSARTAIVELERVIDLGVTEQNVRNMLGRGSRKLSLDLLLAIANGNYGEVFHIIDMCKLTGIHMQSLFEESANILLTVAKYN